MPLSEAVLGLKSPSDISRKLEQKVVEEAEAAKEAQEAADNLKYQSTTTSDEAEREELLAKYREKEKEARAHSKEARRIASGAWQGTLSGAGIGTGVGGGVGAVVGTLVGTIASIPLAGLGALIGLPVGLVHGPFFKTGLEKKGSEEAPTEDEQHQAVIQALDLVKDGSGKEEEVSNGGDKGQPAG